jgi:hypothetical protein
LLHYARHFVLLASFSAVLAIIGWRAGLGIGAQFALYGALHASALVLSIRDGVGARVAPLRRLLFVVLAAMLALANARVGLWAWHAVSAVGGRHGPLILVAACAALGALAYAASINAVLPNRHGGPVPFAATATATALGCAAATCVSFAVSRALHAATVPWLTIAWWFAFSGSLWYADRRRV